MKYACDKIPDAGDAKGDKACSKRRWTSSSTLLCGPCVSGLIALLILPFASLAQTDPMIGRSDYRNEIFNPVFTNGQPSSLTQCLAVAFYSGNIGAATNELTTSTNIVRPNDGTYYLVQSIIGQPIGVAAMPFDLVTNGSGTITSAPNPYAATNWYQFGQNITLYAQPGRYYVFTNWWDGTPGTSRPVVVGLSNYYQVNFAVSNGITLETNVLAGFTNIAPRGTPSVLLTGIYYPFNIVPATNGTQFALTITNGFVNGTNYYSINGSGFITYTGQVSVTAPFSISAQSVAPGGLASATADALNTLSVTNAGGGGVGSLSLKTDFYTGIPSATITATNAPGWSFLHWTNDAVGPSDPLTLTITQRTSVAAVFGTPVFTLASLGSGSVARGPDQSNYVYGSTVRLSATPAAGYYFKQWGGALDGVSDTVVDFVVTNQMPTNGAQFFPVGTNFALTLGKQGYGTVSNSPPHDPLGWFYSPGTVVILTAQPALGQTLVGWSGDASGTNSQLSITMTNSKVITASFAPAQPVFLLSSNNYSVNESDGFVSITVSNIGAFGGMVDFTTLDTGSAVGAPGATGDYTITTNRFVFTNQGAQSIVVPIRDQFLSGPDKSFKVRLSNPQHDISSTNASLIDPTNATVTIHYNDALTTNGSLLVQAFPGPLPDLSGSLQIFLDPPTNITGGTWHFPWEVDWRPSGQLVTNLATDSSGYDVVYRNLPGYLVRRDLGDQPVSGPVHLSVSSSPNPTQETNHYQLVGGASTGWLKVSIGPNTVPNPHWQFVGETNFVHLPGETVSNLPPGSYVVQFQTISNWVTPASQQINIAANAGRELLGYYDVADALPPTAARPYPLLSFYSITNSVANSPRLPFAFNGQLESEVGFGSGVAVRSNVVLTAAHLLFLENPPNFSYVSNVYWFFQRQAGEFDPRPLVARGYYLLSGYASARTNFLANTNNTPAQSTNLTRNLDVGAIYFLSPTVAGRGGYGGYLTSDAMANEWLASTNLKMMVGYPVDGSSAGYTFAAGKMHTNAAGNYSFRPQDNQTNNQVYFSSDFIGFPGNSGSPVYVQDTNNIYYPAAVYLGTVATPSGNVSAVRAINSDVVNLIDLAERSANLGDTGTNFTGGGVIRIVPSQGSGSLAYIKVSISPQAAIDAGAGWRLQGSGTQFFSDPNHVEIVASGTTATVEFTNIFGWDGPTNRDVDVELGITTTINALYTRSAQLAVSPTPGFSASGYVGGPFAPPSATYTLTNLGEAALVWAVSNNVPWLTVSPTGGTLAPSAGTNVTLTTNSVAAALAPGAYPGTVSFANLTNDLGTTNRSASLTVVAHAPITLSSLRLLSDGRVAMALQGDSNAVYSILTSINLLVPLTNWTELQRVTNFTGQITFTNPPATNAHFFFRARAM